MNYICINYGNHLIQIFCKKKKKKKNGRGEWDGRLKNSNREGFPRPIQIQTSESQLGIAII